MSNIDSQDADDIAFYNLMSSYEGYFMEYLILLDTFGDLSGGSVRVLDGYNATTSTLLIPPPTDTTDTTTTTTTTTDTTATDTTDTTDTTTTTTGTTETDANACWETCASNTSCILSNFNSTNSLCNLYGKPDDVDGTFSYVADDNYTSTIYNDDYYYYMILSLNDKLQAYNGQLSQALESKGITEKDLVKASILKSELQRHHQKLVADMALLMASQKNTTYSNEYNDTYLDVESNNTLYSLWFAVAVFSALVAFILCYSIIKEKISSS